MYAIRSYYGMQTKLHAATLAAKSGASTMIASGLEEDILTRLAAGEAIGTLLKCSRSPLSARKQWLAGQSQVHGTLLLDEGAVRVLVEKARDKLKGLFGK